LSKCIKIGQSPVGDLGLKNLAAVLTPLQLLWDPAVALAPVHLDLRGVTFVWPSAIALLDRDDYIRLLLEHYQDLEPEYKAQIPLRKVWMPME
jgi:hypothetical protein